MDCKLNGLMKKPDGYDSSRGVYLANIDTLTSIITFDKVIKLHFVPLYPIFSVWHVSFQRQDAS